MPLTTHDPVVVHTHTDTDAAHAASWRTDLEAAVLAHPGHHDFQLATVSPDGPRVRTVTYQRFSPSDFIIVGTNRYSGKVGDLAHMSAVEVAWVMLPEAKQYRIRGRAVVVGERDEFEAKASPVLGRNVWRQADAECRGAHPELRYEWWAHRKQAIFASLPPGLRNKYDHPPPPEWKGIAPRVCAIPGPRRASYNFVLVAIIPERVEVLNLVGAVYTVYVRGRDGLWHVEGPDVKL